MFTIKCMTQKRQRTASIQIFFKEFPRVFSTLFSCFLPCMLSSHAMGKDKKVTPFSTENHWQSSQTHASGGIGNASQDFVDQFFADPSLSAEEKAKFQLQWASLHASYSKDLVTTTQDVLGLIKDSDSNSGSKVVKALDTFQSAFGKRLTGGLNLTLFATQIGAFTMVPYVSAFVDGDINVPSWPQAELVADAYAGLGFGYAKNFNKMWSIGANIRPGVRSYASVGGDVSAVGGFATSGSSGSAASTSSSSSGFVQKVGTALYVPIDVGLGYSPKLRWRWHLTFRNFGGAPALSVMSGTKTPVYPMRIQAGANWKVWENTQQQTSLFSEFQDLMGLSEPSAIWYRWQWAAQYLYRLPFRAQTSFGAFGGLRSGYPSYGAFLDLVLLKVEAAAYSRELGQYIGQRPEKCYSIKAYTQMTF